MTIYTDEYIKNNADKITEVLQYLDKKYNHETLSANELFGLGIRYIYAGFNIIRNGAIYKTEDSIIQKVFKAKLEEHLDWNLNDHLKKVMR
jgi:hypothetical protein